VEAHPPDRLDGGPVVLRRGQPDDATAIAHAVATSLEHLAPWMPWAGPEAADADVQRRRLLESEAAWASGREYEYLILTKPDGLLAGGCGLHRRIGPGRIEIGYWVHVAFASRGFATAAARALTAAALALPGIEAVEIHCDAANMASKAIPARLGYRLDRTEDDEIAAPGESGRSMIWVRERGPD
jgi:RimJ/RimL family protein N-acetyltransferase